MRISWQLKILVNKKLKIIMKNFLLLQDMLIIDWCKSSNNCNNQGSTNGRTNKRLRIMASSIA